MNSYNTTNLPPSYQASVQDTHIPQIIVNENDEQIIYVYNLSKSIKCLTVIDLIFCVLNAYYYLPLLLSSVLIFMGYYGASNYNRYSIIGYIIYNFIHISFQIYSYLYLANNIYEHIFIVCSIVISLWIIKIIIKFFNILGDLHQDKILALKNGFVPTTIYYVWH